MVKLSEPVLQYASKASKPISRDWRIYLPSLFALAEPLVMLRFGGVIHIRRVSILSIDQFLMGMSVIWFLPSLGIAIGAFAPSLVEERLALRLIYLIGMVACLLLWVVAPFVV